MQVMAENLATALFQASPDCVEILDRQGRLVEINPGGRALLEIDDGATLRNRTWSSLWPDGLRARIFAILEDARAGRVGAFEADRPTSRGTPKHWEVSVIPIRDGSGAVAQILATSRDVTVSRLHQASLARRLEEQQAALVALIDRLDAERRRAEASRLQLSHTEKLRILGRFVGSVVHDINNVLASMAGAARLLRRRAEDARTLDILEHVDRAVDRGVTLVRRLLDFARSGETVPEPIDVGAALAADVDLLRHLVGRSIDLTLEPEAGLWPVLIAPSRLQAVLFNLVANARDALGDASGRVRLVARNRRSPEGDRVEIAVVDDGPGMPPEVMARLGEPFFTTKEPGKGTGLGIPSAFDLAEEAGGHVEIDSAPGRGTRIALVLPRAGVEGRPFDTPDATIDPTLHGGATVLVVAAEAPLRSHFATLLRSLRYDVIEAPDRATAEAVFAAALPIDLVLADLDPGTESGAGLAEINRRRGGRPIVFCCDRHAGTVPDGAVVLWKPIDERRLVRVLLERLGRIPPAVDPN